jgi:hypothetical protein
VPLIAARRPSRQSRAHSSHVCFFPGTFPSSPRGSPSLEAAAAAATLLAVLAT